MKSVGDNFEVLMTILAVSANNILYLLTSALGTNIQEMSVISNYFHLLRNCHQHKVINIYLANYWNIDDWFKMSPISLKLSLTWSQKHYFFTCIIVTEKCCLVVTWSRCHQHIDELCDVGGNFQIMLSILRCCHHDGDIIEAKIEKWTNLSPKIKICHYHFSSWTLVINIGVA